MADKDFRPLLADLATGVWRLNNKLTDNAAEAEADPAKLLRALSRQVTSMADALAEAGIQVQSHTGEPFDGGQSVQVIAYAPAATADRERVAETIMPTVYVDGQLVQMGQIIVATPESVEQ
ncbi:hypothetical protein [Nocardia macrotermitis]|uniref:Nucleotide exchange factor GrpE n=1 Tax=Nocardia macrotermitis TaxID=2585198 RepID=A0A7K0D413_9NOCA|nr:hypothetical protein [Nocardia macrotermitis]MQY20483.1 hypothetical protein [Nocardia macrotermitis]